MKQTNKYEGIEELKALALENGDGVYLIYADHLSCDAVIAFTVKENTIEDEIELTPGYGAGCLSYQFKEKYLTRHTEAQVFGFTASWFTFPSVWRNDETFLKKYVYESVTLIATLIEKA